MRFDSSKEAQVVCSSGTKLQCRHCAAATEFGLVLTELSSRPLCGSNFVANSLLRYQTSGCLMASEPGFTVS